MLVEVVTGVQYDVTRSLTGARGWRIRADWIDCRREMFKVIQLEMHWIPGPLRAAIAGTLYMSCACYLLYEAPERFRELEKVCDWEARETALRILQLKESLELMLD